MTSDNAKTPGAASGARDPETAAALDWAAMEARMERRRAEAARALATERAALLAALRGRGVDRIVAVYDGYGDSGNVSGVAAEPAEASPGDLERRLADFVWDVAYDLHPGFEIDDGGEGTVTWDLRADRIDVEHADFVTERLEHVHEDV